MIEIEGLQIEINQKMIERDRVIAIIRGTMQLGAKFSKAGQRTLHFAEGSYAWVVKRYDILPTEPEVEVYSIVLIDNLDVNDYNRVEKYLEDTLQKIPWETYEREIVK